MGVWERKKILPHAHTPILPYLTGTGLDQSNGLDATEKRSKSRGHATISLLLGCGRYFFIEVLGERANDFAYLLPFNTASCVFE